MSDTVDTPSPDNVVSLFEQHEDESHQQLTAFINDVHAVCMKYPAIQGIFIACGVLPARDSDLQDRCVHQTLFHPGFDDLEARRLYTEAFLADVGASLIRQTIEIVRASPAGPSASGADHEG